MTLSSKGMGDLVLQIFDSVNTGIMEVEKLLLELEEPEPMIWEWE